MTVVLRPLCLNLARDTTLTDERGVVIALVLGGEQEVHEHPVDDEPGRRPGSPRRTCSLRRPTALTQELVEDATGVGASGAACDLGRRAARDDAASTFTALRAEVDDVVGFRDDIEVVLDHDHRVAGFDQPVEDCNELRDVGHVQADGGLVQNVE